MLLPNAIKELDVVALLTNVPEAHLSKGAIGTVIHVYNKNIYEIEFADLKGETYALATLPAENLLLLKHEPATV